MKDKFKWLINTAFPKGWYFNVAELAFVCILVKMVTEGWKEFIILWTIYAIINFFSTAATEYRAQVWSKQ